MLPPPDSLSLIMLIGKHSHCSSYCYYRFSAEAIELWHQKKIMVLNRLGDIWIITTRNLD